MVVATLAQGGPHPPRPRPPSAALQRRAGELRPRDSYGARHVRVRGHARVACHLFLRVLALTGGQLMRPTI